MIYKRTIVLFSLFALCLADETEIAPQVVLEQGIVSGLITNNGTILEYVGIPYGTVNISNRFQAPYPPPHWEGVYEATTEYTCTQGVQFLDMTFYIGTEDCLKVNVYVPAGATAALPVMLWVHGGGFVTGSGGKQYFGPEFLLQHDVILVTINYRLGALGFLCLGIEEAPGNAGLKDILAAIRWVKNNIAAFGGDPDNITLFGESAGGALVSILVASETTNGLINKAIVQSGSAVSNWAILGRPLYVASHLAKALGNDTEDPHEIYKLVAEMPVNELLDIKLDLPFNMYSDASGVQIPCVEIPIEGVESIITDLPYNLLKSNPKNIPVMYGSTSREGLFVIPAETEETAKLKNEMYLFASDLEFSSTEEAERVDRSIKDFYFGANATITLSEHRNNLIDYHSHFSFEFAAIYESELAIQYTTGPLYSFIFAYSGERNYAKRLFDQMDEEGASHSDELLYLFNGDIWPYPPNESDAKVIDTMTRLWTNFAKYGNPTPDSETVVPIKWEPNTKDKVNVMYLDEEVRMGSVQSPAAHALWRDIYDKYRRTDISYFQPITVLLGNSAASNFANLFVYLSMLICVYVNM